MAAEITPELVRRIAGLAALRLDDDEVERLAGEMADILEHFEALKDVAGHGDTEEHGDTEGHGGTEAGALLRADEVGADRLAEPPAEQAPEWRDGFFTVPRLGSHGGPRPTPAPEDGP